MTPLAAAEERALSLVRKLGPMADPAMRIGWLRAEWVSRGASEVAEVLEATAQGADAGVVPYRDVLLQLAVAIAPDGFVSLRREAAVHAIGRGYDNARALLVPETRREPEREFAERRAPAPIPGRTVTLGERKSLARGRTRTTLDRILHDPHPDVIRILLSNPVVRESDVQRISALRPVVPEVLREVFVHPRWFVRYPIRLALVQNPNLPTDIGIALVRQLLKQDALAIAAATELPESVREAALREAARVALH